MTETTACPLDLSTLSDAVRRHVGGSGGPPVPPPLRMMAARGLAPIPPRDLVTAQFVLSFDGEPKIAAAAEKSLREIEPRLAAPVFGDTAVPSPVLGFLAQIHATNGLYARDLLLNPSTPTEVFEDVASICGEDTLELIANNQARLLEHPNIVRGIVQNPNTPRSTRDRVLDFLVRNGVVLEGVPFFEDALLRLGKKERLEAAQNIEIPLDMLDESMLTAEQRDALADGRRLVDEPEEEAGSERRPIEERLRNMTMPQLVASATKGNKQVRKFLLRHTNRLVAVAAVTSPMIQEPEIIEAANSKTTHQDAIAHIAKDKKNNWVKNYQVKLALVSNPKTPSPDAMRLLPLLNARDKKLLAKSHNVPAAVRNMANRLSKGR